MEDIEKHGMCFTINIDEVFRFVICSGFEEYGCSLAKISFKADDGEFIKDAHILKGGDTEGTFCARKFIVKKIYSLNDYDLIIKLYNVSRDKFKQLVQYAKIML